MYHPFFQFFLPRVGQLALAGLLYGNFLQLPPLEWLRPWPLLYYGVPLALVVLLGWLARDPLGLGVVLVGYLTALYCAGNLLGLAARLAGGAPWALWRALWLQGLTPWLVTGLVWWGGHRRAVNLRTTTYTLTTGKPLPGGALTVVQLSDLHPNPKAAMHRGRIPELRAKVEACHPDLLVFTGDVFDEFTAPEEFDAFCALFGQLQAPLGKYYVLGNHDLFHHWREPSYDRAALETALARAGVRLLEDTAVLAGGVRIVGRKDYLYTGGRRADARALLPGGPDDRYTLWLDHEPRDFRNAAAAGADLILSGHTHGGQVWPAGAVGMAARNERNYGKKQVGPHCTAIVSGGTGTWGYRLRTQGRTEIVCVKVQSR